jgi:hypothetical protein
LSSLDGNIDGIYLDPERRKQFTEFINIPRHSLASKHAVPHSEPSVPKSESSSNLQPTPTSPNQALPPASVPDLEPLSERILERSQRRPADWPKNAASLKFTKEMLRSKDEVGKWGWVRLARVLDMFPDMLANNQKVDARETRGAAVKYGKARLAVYWVEERGEWFVTQQMYVLALLYPSFAPSVLSHSLFMLMLTSWHRCPHRRAFVLDHGIIGESSAGGDVVRSSFCSSFDPLALILLVRSTSPAHFTNATSP